MLVFVIPLKSSIVSNNWERVTQLLERCLKSVCNQTSPNFRAIVVGHEKPVLQFSHPHIHYLTVNFPVPQQAPQESKQQFLDRKRTDKGRKMLKGLVYASQFNPSHTMLVDADDVISNRLAQLVSQNPKSNGWYINQGYRYEEGRDFIYYKRQNFYRMCGSCNIVRYDLNELPEHPEYNRGYGYYKRYIDHEKTKGILEAKHTPLKPLPFAGAIYTVANGENQYYDKNRFHNGVFNLFNNRRLTSAIREEFSLYPISSQVDRSKNLQLTLRGWANSRWIWACGKRLFQIPLVRQLFRTAIVCQRNIRTVMSTPCWELWT